ncbi:MAG: SNF2 helicase associated domain-containing protein, partial [Planctomycetes bacterium]|nr:SNF2 helicase associated domain-containing protein [Planctomycetota bacterium]
MLLTQLLKGAFSSKDRSRGQQYFASRHVQNLEFGADDITADVYGSLGNTYEVTIDRVALGKGKFAAECSCPRFGDGHLCKHLWAVVMAIDAADVPSVEGGRRVQGKSASKTDNQAWRRQLKLVGREAERIAEEAPDLRDTADLKSVEIWYALNIGASQASGQLIVEMLCRRPKKNGELSKPRRLNIGAHELPAIARSDDRAALASLLNSNAGIDYDSRYNGYSGNSSSSIAPQPELFEVVMPLLAATGRLVWVLEEGDAIEPERKLTWDDGPPWLFRLIVDDDPKQKSWNCRGELYRDKAPHTAPSQDAKGKTDETTSAVSLDVPMLLSAGGMVIWPDRVARLDAAGQFPWIKMLRQQQELTVPYDGRTALQQSIWSAPAKVTCRAANNFQLKEVQVAPQGRLKVKKPKEDRYSFGPRELKGEVAFLYGDVEVPAGTTSAGIVRSQGDEVVVRDPAAEAALMGRLKALKIRGDTYYRSQPNEVAVPPNRLESLVETLTLEGWLVEAEGLRIRRAGAWNMSVTSGVDWFDLNGKIDFDGQSVTLPELLAAVKRGETYVKLGDGSRGMLPKDWLARYGSLAAMGEANGESLRFASCQALMLDAMLAEQDGKDDRPFKQLRDKLRSFTGIAPIEEPEGFGGELRQYQREGLGWLEFLRDFRFGGCLADDMGLGKTIQVLALLERRRKRRLTKDETRAPSLVVVPKSLIFNWMDEAARFTPNLKVLNYTGLGRRDNGQPAEYDVVVTTYGTLRKDIADLRKTRFDYAILDEAQAIKNSSSQAAKACRLIAADHRLAMTGTPVENHLGELWSLFEFLNPGMLGQSAAFQSATKGSGEEGPAAFKPLATALAPFILRRTKEQVLKELPAKTEQTLYCEMEPAQRKQYEELRDYYRASLASRIKEVGLKRAKIHVLESLLRLRQVACHPGLVDKKKIKEPSAKLD